MSEGKEYTDFQKGYFLDLMTTRNTCYYLLLAGIEDNTVHWLTLIHADSVMAVHNTEQPLCSLYFASKEPDFIVIFLSALEAFWRFLNVLFLHWLLFVSFSVQFLYLTTCLKLTYESFNHKKGP